jgi:hypothetical protein
MGDEEEYYNLLNELITYFGIYNDDGIGIFKEQQTEQEIASWLGQNSKPGSMKLLETTVSSSLRLSGNQAMSTTTKEKPQQAQSLPGMTHESQS